jgi:hypothetical protein
MPALPLLSPLFLWLSFLSTAPRNTNSSFHPRSHIPWLGSGTCTAGPWRLAKW